MSAPAHPPPRILVLPGLGGSGPEHWQTRWEALIPGARRVQQRDWDHPRLADWLAALRRALAEADGPAVLVAHSLACALVAHAARTDWGARIRAALLVAPADVDSPAHTPPEVRGFAPMPLGPLPFPAHLVASHDDPYVTFARARHFAARWGAAFTDIGARGHINATSGLGDWDDGRRMLEALVEGVS